MITKNQRNIILFSIPVLLLSIPLLAMQFTKEVNWSVFDFLIAAVILFGAVFTISLILEKFKTTKSRFVLIFTTLAIVFLIWIELAVGIFGSPFAGS